ncbi:uncharacterized protein METZ01_LOCUS183116 [marine metagenome]|uniref:DUF4282 domain-containing protein n=1 Tax=marine metagenome TaxID=408172 RepID=A0A382CWP8_9ZZZZ
MSTNEIFDSIKKSTKSAYDKIDKQAVLYLDEMVTPKLVTFFYWILLFAFITKGIGDMFEGDFFRGLVWVVGGALTSRVACELMIVVFHINDNLHSINSQTKEVSKESPDEIFEASEKAKVEAKTEDDEEGDKEEGDVEEKSKSKKESKKSNKEPVDGEGDLEGDNTDQPDNKAD